MEDLKQDTINHYRKYKTITKEEANSLDYTDIVNYKFGDWILFQHVIYTSDRDIAVVSKPILAIYLGYDVWDMAQVMYFVENEIPFYKEEKYAKSINQTVNLNNTPLVQEIILWTDSIIELGNWSHKPSVAELKEGLKLQYK